MLQLKLIFLIFQRSKYSIELFIMHPPQNKILNEKISIDFATLIGKGATGNVFKGTSLDPYPHPIAIKVIPLKEINNEVTSYLLQCELQALKTLAKASTQYIVKLKEIIVIDQQCYVAMELLEGGTLKEYIEKSKKVDEHLALTILQKILEGYKMIKSHGIVHRDLKPGNIMFQKKLVQEFILPKIIDFGYCKMEKVKNKPKMFYNVGSPRYMSPEAYKENIYTQKSDIWSIGIIFYEMLTGNTLDKGKDIPQTFAQIREKGIPIPSKLSKKSKKIIQNMLMFNPEKRATCESVLGILYTNDEEIILQSELKFDVKSSQVFKNRPENFVQRENLRILQVQKKESPQSKKAMNKIDQTLYYSKNKNNIVFHQPHSPMVSPAITFNERKTEKKINFNKYQIHKTKPHMISTEKHLPAASKREEKQFLFQSGVPIQITPCQPNNTIKRNFHQRNSSTVKENQRSKTQDMIFKSQLVTHEPKNHVKIKIQPNTVKNQFMTIDRSILTPVKKDTGRQGKSVKQFTVSPQPKERQVKTRVSFHQPLNNSMQLAHQSTQSAAYDVRASNAYQLGHKKGIELNRERNEVQQHYYPLREAFNKKLPLR